MLPGSGSETPAGTLAGGRWLAAQPDSAATHTTAAAATTPTARMLIRRTTVRPGCADFSAGTAVPLVGLARSDQTWPRLGRARRLRDRRVSGDVRRRRITTRASRHTGQVVPEWQLSRRHHQRLHQEQLAG